MLTEFPRMLQRNQAMTLSLSDPMVADLLVQGRTELIVEAHAIPILGMAASPISVDDLVSRLAQDFRCSAEAARAEIASLLRKGVLTCEGESAEDIAAVRHWEERGWIEALILHSRTCNLRYADAVTAIKGNDAAAADKEYDSIPPSLRDRGEITEGHAYALDGGAQLPAEAIQDVLLRRRSGGPARGTNVALAELSAIMRWANQKGLENRKLASHHAQRNSAASRIWSSFCCLETFVIAAEVTELERGIYFYDVARHELILQRRGDFRNQVSDICIGQPWPRDATFSLMIVCDWLGYQLRYQHPRAYRNLLINTGELAQRYLIGATAFHLGNFITPALRDSLACDLFNLNDSHASPMYSLSFA